MKKLFIILCILAVCIIIGVFSLNYYLKNKINDFIKEEIPSSVKVEYDALEINSWSGTAHLSNVSVVLQSPNDSLPSTHLTSENLRIQDLSYWDYLVNKKIHINKIEITDNSLTYYQTKQTDTSSKEQEKPIKLNKNIEIDAFKIGPSSITIFDNVKDSLLLKIPHLTFDLKEIRTDENIVNEKLPIEFASINIEADSIFYRLNPYDNLKISNLDLKDNSLKIKNASIQTKYSRSRLSQIIPKERDHMNLSIPEMTLNEIDWGFQEDRFFAKGDQMIISQPNFNIYRDKLVTDDHKIKPLYSKMLRELPIDLMINNITIDDANIYYSEKVKSDQPAGEIEFNNLNASIKNVGNTYNEGEKLTALDIDATFMNQSPIHVNWNFDVQNKLDVFRFKSDVGQLNADAMNSFTEPNLLVELSGELKKSYFDISGNNNTAQINMKMDYDEFKIAVLNKKKKKNWLVSTIANIFVSKDSDDQEDKRFREGSGNATRDKTKSIFNYLWLSVKSGLISTMTGDGDKS